MQTTPLHNSTTGRCTSLRNTTRRHASIATPHHSTAFADQTAPPRLNTRRQTSSTLTSRRLSTPLHGTSHHTSTTSQVTAPRATAQRPSTSPHDNAVRNSTTPRITPRPHHHAPGQTTTRRHGKTRPTTSNRTTTRRHFTSRRFASLLGDSSLHGKPDRNTSRRHFSPMSARTVSPSVEAAFSGSPIRLRRIDERGTGARRPYFSAML